ncbi:MAG: hypothetical protein AAGA18_01555 [Verrucomicrobiota bacterium]
MGRFIIVLFCILVFSPYTIKTLNAESSKIKDPDNEEVKESRHKKFQDKEFERGKKRPKAKPGLLGERNLRGKHPPMTMQEPGYEKLVRLALMDTSKLDEHISQKPDLAGKPFAQDMLKNRLTNFRNRLTRQAKDFAKGNGLNVSEDRILEFTKYFWQKRIEIEHQLEPQRQELLAELSDELKYIFDTN